MRSLAFATRVSVVCNSAPSPTVLVVDPAKCSPALLEMLIERGAMRVTVPTR